MGRAIESRNVIFIENRESTLIGSTATNINVRGFGTHGDSSTAENTDDISISLTHRDRQRVPKKLSNLITT